MSRREFGRFLRLVGPLVQIPCLWCLLKYPEWAARNLVLVYCGMLTGLIMVVAGLAMSFKGKQGDGT